MELNKESRHYMYSNVQPYDVIVDWKLGFELGNILKYICRRIKKETYEKNRDKWRDYARMAIERGGDLMVGAVVVPTVIVPWHVELRWEIEEKTEEYEFFWAVWAVARSGGNVNELRDVYEEFAA